MKPQLPEFESRCGVGGVVMFLGRDEVGEIVV
jgi:hypothetical protein